MKLRVTIDCTAEELAREIRSRGSDEFTLAMIEALADTDKFLLMRAIRSLLLCAKLNIDEFGWTFDTKEGQDLARRLFVLRDLILERQAQE